MMHRAHISRFYFRILLRLSVIKSFFAMGWILITTIPKVPFLGNLLQLLKERKPRQSFTTWATKYGPIFSIQVGSVKRVVITSPKIEKEVQKKFKINLELLDRWSFLLEALCENFMFFTKKEMFVIYLQSVFRNYFVHAMITKYEIISSKKLPLELQIIARDKTNISFSYYDNQYCMLKKLLVSHLLINISTQIVTILY